MRGLQGIYPTVIIVLVSLKMTFYDDVTRAQKTMTTFQAEAPSTDFRTTTDTTSRRRGRGAVESDETDSTYVLEPLSFSQRKSINLQVAASPDPSVKRDDLV